MKLFVAVCLFVITMVVLTYFFPHHRVRHTHECLATPYEEIALWTWPGDGIPRIVELYPPVNFAKVADGKWKRPRAKVEGLVKAVRKEADGDIHIELTSGGKLIVLEIIPELKFAPPKVGDSISAWGIVREDGWHGWWELHPLVGWELKK